MPPTRRITPHPTHRARHTLFASLASILTRLYRTLRTRVPPFTHYREDQRARTTTMRPILPTWTSSASVHPTTPVEVETPSLGSSPPLRSRWFHRVGDFFLGTPSSGHPVKAPATHRAGGGGGQDSTMEEAEEEPIIRWFFAFKRGEDNDALVADGWRWRMQVMFAMCGMLATFFTVLAIFGVLPRWIDAPSRWLWGGPAAVATVWVALAAVATVLAVFQNSSCLRRSTTATMMNVILHLALLAMCVNTLLVDGSPAVPENKIVDAQFDAWFRGEFALSMCLGSYILALLLPASRAGCWFGIVFQVTVVPAIRVRGVVGGGGTGRASGHLTDTTNWY